jgi:hypothetical protein
MSDYKNPFEYEQATTLTRDFVNTVFIENHSFTRFIQSTRNVILSGERGSGKSMTLLYNSLSFRTAQNHSGEQEHLGIYIPCNTTLTHKREFELFDSKEFPPLVSEHFMVLGIAHAIATELDAVPALLDAEADAQLREELEYVLGIQLASSGTALRTFMLYLEKESTRSQTALNALRHDEFRASAYTFSSLVHPFLLALRRTARFRESHFLLLFDDAHDLNIHQKRTLNSWLAYRDRSAFSFKVAVADLLAYDFQTVSGSTILEGHDFLVIDLQKPFQSSGSDFGKMARDVIEKRLLSVGVQVTADAFFPQSRDFEADMELCREETEREAALRYPDPSDTKKRRDYVYKYARVKYFRGRNPKSNLPPYAGMETIAHLSTGVIRNLLMPCYWMYDAVYSERPLTQGELIVSVSPEVQSKVIHNQSARLWHWMQHSLVSSIENCTLADSNRIFQFFDNLGVLFRARLLQEASEPRAIAFSVSGWNDDLELNLRPLLAICRRAQLLYFREGAAKDEGRRETYYVPNRMLWPIRGLDVVGQHARVSLKARDIWAAANGTAFAYASSEVIQGGLFDE